ncbi:hypothetical protein M3080_01085 [Parasutterella secunda]|uniref:hypothetical protein n=1 Tax=Parasutterella secunda TaxID=626947 RepID=UPI0020137D49|nr:hypothetical protein [Parasutterella secunda]MCL1595969.1 hypothetical protein [Parasutterella secunda]
MASHKVVLSSKKQGILGIVGHAGCGHCNSHLGFIQDDSGGLTAVMALLTEATGLSLEIESVKTVTGMDGFFEVRTKAGGVGRAHPRRGITAAEARLAQWAVGQDATCSQTVAMNTFGRILGQGAMEVPVAFQTAVANAALDSFARNFPGQFLLSDEKVPGNGGIGPNEDIEGNVCLFGKEEVMKPLGLDHLPTFLLEGKVCASPVSDEIQENTFLIRAHTDADNPVVAECYIEAAKRLGYPATYRPEMLARSENAMRNLTEEMGKRIQEFGKELAQATTAIEKCRISAAINEFASQELGGITFMGDNIHKIMGGVGQIPGLTACMSLFVPRSSIQRDVLPSLSMQDAHRYAEILERRCSDPRRSVT